MQDQSPEDIKQKVIELLKNVYDPEIPINVYDLGLIYDIIVDNDRIEVIMGLTSPLCPIAGIVLYQVESMLREHFKDKRVEVRLDYSRVWTPERMTEDGRKLFKALYGYDILERK